MSARGTHFDAGDAALYAVGALDDVRQRGVERHAAQCDECARILSQAEDAVATMAAAQPQYATTAWPATMPVPRARPASARTAWLGPLAAAFALAVVSTAYLWQQNHTMQTAMTRDEQIVAQFDEGPFRTARFHGMPGGAQARVMYAPDGSWYVVLVRGATRALQVAWMHDGTATMLGDARPHGRLAMFYLPKSHRMDRLALMDGGEVVAEAELAY